jgi:hypothetical protein
MQTTERQTIKPIGLARFLVSHGECGEGYEALRDRRVVTVICRGCEASFSYLTDTSPASSRSVENALLALAETSGPDRDDANDRAPEHTPPGPEPAGTASGQAGPKRLPPPGPLAPRRRRSRSIGQLLGPPLTSATRGIARAVDRRRRPIALAALALAGAYVLIALTVGGEPSSSQDSRPVGGPEVPVTAPPTTTLGAEGAQFRVALPSDWGSSLGADGRTLMGPLAGGAEIQVIAGPSDGQGVTEEGNEAAALLAAGLPKGTKVTRLPAQPVGNLLAVASATTASGARTAYVGLSDAATYQVIEHTRADAPAPVKLQAEGVISSFEPAD